MVPENLDSLDGLQALPGRQAGLVTAVSSDEPAATTGRLGPARPAARRGGRGRSDLRAGWSQAVAGTLHRRGVVVAMSGGIDSSVCAALAVRALGAAKVFGLLLPGARLQARQHRSAAACSPSTWASATSSRTSRRRSQAIGCYRRRDEAIRRGVPRVRATAGRCKIAIAGGARRRRSTSSSWSCSRPDGDAAGGAPADPRVPADRRRHQLQAAHPQDARVLPRRPAELRGRSARRTGSSTTRASSSRTATAPPTSSRSRTCTRRRSTRWRGTWACPTRSATPTPTTDTYSLPQGQDEFYFALPYEQMDLALWAHNHAVPAERAGRGAGPDRRAGARSSTATSRPSGGRRATCTRGRCWSSP